MQPDPRLSLRVTRLAVSSITGWGRYAGAASAVRGQNATPALSEDAGQTRSL